MSEFLKEGYYVRIDEGSIPVFYKVVAREPFQYDTGEEATAHFSAVATAGESGWINITTLEPDDRPRRLYQVRLGVAYSDRNLGMSYFFKIPTGNNRFGVDVDKDIGFIDGLLSPFDAPTELFEFWLIHDYYPSINAKNNCSISLTPKVRFVGMKYDIPKVQELIEQGVETVDTLAKLRDGRIPYKIIILGGVRT